VREASVIVSFPSSECRARRAGFGFRAYSRVIGDLGAGIILEKFRVGPLHAAVREQGFGGFPRTAESFEQKDGVGKFLLDSGG